MEWTVCEGTCVRVLPSAMRGKINAPPSKSLSHRMLICAALADGVSVLDGIALSEDIAATVDVLEALGAQFEWFLEGEERDAAQKKPAAHTGLMPEWRVRVHGCGGKIATETVVLPCRESGSTLRFVIPLCLTSTKARRLSGSHRLLSRPLGVYQSLFASRWGGGIIDEQQGFLQLLAGDAIAGGEYQLPGNVSSQFVSGLLLAFPLCEQDSRITLTTEPESKSYIDLTLSALEKFGIVVHALDARTYQIPGGQGYRPWNGCVERDASNAAFFAALNCLGGEVEVGGLSADSLQGDRVFSTLLDQLSAPRANEERLWIDLADCPDLAPILFAVAAATGGACFTHTNRLRDKESDRIAAMQQELQKFGATIWEPSGYEDLGGAVCVGGSVLHPPVADLNGHNDHRVVMSLAVLATRYGGTICGADAVKKSLPDFFERLSLLGAKLVQEGAEESNATDER